MMRASFKIVGWMAAAVALIALLAPISAEAASKKRRIEFSEKDAIRVEGKIIRPELSLILQRSKINYDALKLKESFLPRIIRSVKQEPF